MRRVRYAIEVVRDRLDDRRTRGHVPGAVRDAEILRGAGSPSSLGAQDRVARPFEREAVLHAFGRTATIEDRSYPYVLLPGQGNALCINYSAFFGEWGERRRARSQYQGWFHRLRMFWPLVDYHFLFLCDTYGAEQNGTYYKGVNQDFFVERAIDRIQEEVAAKLGVDPRRTVTIGSSMGATAALRFALRHGYAGAVAVKPHIDLDISALRQGRLPHVTAVLGRNDVEHPELRPITREIRGLADRVRPLPRLVMQSNLDDHGVHSEQVMPLAQDLARGRRRVSDRVWRGRRALDDPRHGRVLHRCNRLVSES